VDIEPRGGEPAETALVRADHRRLEQLLADLDDDVARQPSLLPGWSVGHVVTHLARNADGMARMYEGAARGEIAEMYPGGAPRRAADIEAGHARPAAELLADLHGSVARLEAAWAASSWEGSGLTTRGEVSLEALVHVRWREVAVHTVDLGLASGWDDVREEFVRAELVQMAMLWAARRPMGLTTLPDAALAAPPRTRLAWLLGRADIAGLPPAGIY
jgi:maleylpyruvate isomerase